MTVSDTVPALYTPPESVHSSPLTPPLSDAKPSTQALRIIKLFWSIKQGRDIGLQPWLTFRLRPDSYNEVLQLLELDGDLREFVEHKIRYDYIPSSHRFILRMPSAVHEGFKVQVVQEIEEQLNVAVRDLSPSADFSRQIKHTGSERLKFSMPKPEGEEGEEIVQHEPDAAFEHRDAQYPGIVIEVSFTQKRKDLPYLADSYILGSDGNVRVVVGLDIEYKTSSKNPSKRATISLWRPEFRVTTSGEIELRAKQTVTDMEIRDKRGVANTSPQAGLRLQLRDFASEVITQEYTNLQGEIFISCEQLSNFLASSEAMAAKKREGIGKADALPAGARKRRRTDTPPDQLDTDDEKNFESLEQTANNQIERGDLTYNLRARSRSNTRKRPKRGSQVDMS